MTSTRPYLLRAIYDWIVDNNMTPHLLVEVSDERVRVPAKFVENGVIVLNTSPGAVRDLELGNEFVSFSARFSGTPHDIVVPIGSVQAIYARENGQGIFLADGEEPKQPNADGSAEARGDAPGPGQERGQRPPHLTIVK